MTPSVLVIGRQEGTQPAGLPERCTGARYVMADDAESVLAHLAGADVVFQYGKLGSVLQDGWHVAERLRWLHLASVGVDWALFPELIESDVVMTNSHGVFETTLPENLLMLMLALLKDLPTTVRAQEAQEWRHRWLLPLAGSRVVIVGDGSLGRAAGRMLRSLRVTGTLVGREERMGAADEGRIRAVADLPELLPAADWLVTLVPLTEETRGLIGATELGLLPHGARFVNISRGPVVVEAALIDAVRSGRLAGAALDVFETEPLPAGHPLWSLPNVIVSPHIGGDVVETPAAYTRVFLSNLERFIAGKPLENVVDKRLGYVPVLD